MSYSVENLVLGVAFVVVLVALIVRRRGESARPAKNRSKKPVIGRGR